MLPTAFNKVKGDIGVNWVNIFLHSDKKDKGIDKLVDDEDLRAFQTVCPAEGVPLTAPCPSHSLTLSLTHPHTLSPGLSLSLSLHIYINSINSLLSRIPYPLILFWTSGIDGSRHS
eukprot:TRINITY_DN7944_c0_g2_i1.p1 TRINITY_DN7944_c0_g2~~TRINITY_DN7944_c0_g2_i1.p1  ORF type:complete len:116 (+),score=1.61 TRINITY_DN7944_c0_g2_i1:68-415(+)